MRRSGGLFEGLASSGGRWNVVAQQTIMARYDYDTGDGVAVNHDQWDGYVASRERFLRFIDHQQPSNPVVLSGDWHSSWVNDLLVDFTDPDSRPVATEFVSTSVSTECPWAPDVQRALSENPHVKFFEGLHRGYVRCTVTPEQWRSDYRVVASTVDPVGPAETLTSWVVENGRPGAQHA